MSEGSEQDERLAREKLWVRSTMWVLIVFLVVGGGVFVFKSCHEVPGAVAGDVLKTAVTVLGDVVSAFRTENVTSSFVSYSTSVEGVQFLQFGSVKQMELFTRSREGTFAYVPLPEVVVEARAPIEYTYYVDLQKEWRFELEGGRVKAYAPAIEFNTPAVDVSGIEYDVKRGTFGTEEVMEDLKRSITYMAKEKARRNKGLVRETGRKAVAQFVRGWLRGTFSDGKDYPVEVVFADDPEEKVSRVPVISESTSQ